MSFRKIAVGIVILAFCLAVAAIYLMGPRRGVLEIDGVGRNYASARRNRNGSEVTSDVNGFWKSISTPEGLRREGKVRLSKLREQKPEDRTESEIMIAIELGAGEDFEAIWGLVDSSDFDADAKYRLLSYLCTSFPAKVGFEVVLNKVVGLRESGAWKNQLISATFRGARDSVSTMLSNASKLEYSDERTAALKGISWRIHAIPIGDIDFSGFAKINSREETKIVGEALGERIRNADRDQKTGEFDATLSGLRQLINDGKADQSILGDFLSAAADTSPLDAWRAWRAMVNERDIQNADSSSNLPKCLVDGLVKIGGAVAMENLMVPELSARPADAKLSGLAFYRWLAKDMNGATAWLGGGDISGLQADYVFQATVQYNMEHEQFDAAKEWALRIGDTKIRDATMKVLAAREANGGKEK